MTTMDVSVSYRDILYTTDCHNNNMDFQERWITLFFITCYFSLY